MLKKKKTLEEEKALDAKIAEKLILEQAKIYEAEKKKGEQERLNTMKFMQQQEEFSNQNAIKENIDQAREYAAKEKKERLFLKQQEEERQKILR